MTTITSSSTKIQWRAGVLAAPLGDLAARWGCSLDETSRRLVALGINDLRVERHNDIAEASCYLPGERHNFSKIAKYVGEIVREQQPQTVREERHLVRQYVTALRRTFQETTNGKTK